MAVSVIQILRAVECEDPLFRTLSNVELCRRADGSLFYSVGNSAVLFKVKHRGEYFALKCYNSLNPYREEIYSQQFRADELFIPSDISRGEWIDITLDHWVEGISMSQYLSGLIAAEDLLSLRALSKAFDVLALELLGAEWAHGDITCDNIIVANDGSLHLIDFDAKFLPSFQGMESVELGTQAFQHPSRSVLHFDRDIDDYSLALISTALSALALNPHLISDYRFSEGLFYDPSKVVTGNSDAMNNTLYLFAHSAALFEYAIAAMLKREDPVLPELYSLLRCKIEGIPPQAAPVNIFLLSGRWGYVNEFEREVIPPIFDAGLRFHQSVAAVCIGSVWHYIDQRANVIFNGSQYLALKSLRNGVGRALTEDGWVEIPEVAGQSVK